VGSLSTTIDGQTGDVGISFNSQTGNVDINFQDQANGVETATEFAASQNTTVTGSGFAGPSPGSSDSTTLFSNTTGNPVVAEFVSGAQGAGFVDPVQIRVQLQDGAGNTITEALANPVNLPLALDPGVQIPTTGSVRVSVLNNSGSNLSYAFRFIGREVV